MRAAGIRADKKLSLIILCLAAVLSVAIFAARSTALSTSGSSVEQYTLVIDAGHGGIDSGATAIDGSKESDINLAIALKLRALAEFYSIDNTMIRQDDTTKSSSEKYSEHNDLVCRSEIVNATENPVLISIHQNSFPTSHPHGAQVLYSATDGSERLGKITHTNIVAQIEPENRWVAAPASEKLYLLSHVSCPAILVECGFMSNLGDMNNLKDDDFQKSFSAVLMASFLQYQSGAVATWRL